MKCSPFGAMRPLSRVRRSLRKLSGRLAARAQRACAPPSSRSTASRARPTTSPTKATLRRERAARRARRLRARARRDRSAARRPPSRPFPSSPPPIARHGLPLAPFHDLLSAFRQDVTTTRYATFDARARLLPALGQSGRPAACSRSTAPSRPPTRARATRSAPALQLTNFWQDVAVDWQKGRVYLPAEDLARFGVTEAQIADARCDDALAGAAGVRDVARARAARVGAAAGARAAVAAAASSCPACIAGGQRILDGIDAVGGDVFRRRPMLSRADWARVARDARVPSAPASRSRIPEAPHDARRILPAEDGAERLELLLQLPVPAAGAPARDHRALRVLPRGRRRRRRSRRSRARAHQARVVAARRSAPRSPARRSIRWRRRCVPVVREFACRRSSSRRSSTAWRWTSSATATSISPSSSSIATASPASSASCRRRSSATRIPRRGDTRATSASRSSSPTSSATSARTRAAAASICRRTSSRASASPRPRSCEHEMTPAMVAADGRAGGARAALVRPRAGRAAARGSPGAAPGAHHGGDLPHAAGRDRARRLSRARPSDRADAAAQALDRVEDRAPWLMPCRRASRSSAAAGPDAPRP